MMSEFWKIFVPCLSGERESLAVHLWNDLDLNSQERVEILRMKNRFSAKNHPDVVNRSSTYSSVENDFNFTLDLHANIWGNTQNYIYKQQFFDFMKCWSATEPNDEQFISTIVKCFRLNAYFGQYRSVLNEPEFNNFNDIESESFKKKRFSNNDNISTSKRERFYERNNNSNRNFNTNELDQGHMNNIGNSSNNLYKEFQNNNKNNQFKKKSNNWEVKKTEFVKDDHQYQSNRRYLFNISSTRTPWALNYGDDNYDHNPHQSVKFEKKNELENNSSERIFGTPSALSRLSRDTRKKQFNNKVTL